MIINHELSVCTACIRDKKFTLIFCAKRLKVDYIFTSIYQIQKKELYKLSD